MPERSARSLGRRSRTLAAVALAIAASTVASEGSAATRSADDYRYFRALSIDLQGRIPLRSEIAAFEADGFDVDGWIDAHLQGAAYAERIRRIYMDLMRLEDSRAFQFVTGPNWLRRVQILGPDGTPQWVYYRLNQRRVRPETDGTFCLTQAEAGFQFNGVQPPIGTAVSVSQATLDAYTTVVKPWWLYKDYRASNPSQIYGSGYADAPSFQPVRDLLVEPDGKTPTTGVRVCNEEAQTAQAGTVYASGRTKAIPAGQPLPGNRLTQPPLDSTFATKNAGQPIACAGSIAYQSSVDCGCGVGLERCAPGKDGGFDPNAFTIPAHVNLGASAPLDEVDAPEGSWFRFWWSQEARQFLDDLVANDRDFREILTGHATVVNGPLASFYEAAAPATMPTSAATFSYVSPQALFDPKNLPADLLPFETERWVRVADRGPLAAGITTMPIFLTKFGSRRGRAHVLYNAFLCRDFVAGNVALTPSTEPNLMIRPGCSTCHVTLEPLAAYFSRVLESDWTYLPSANFPISSPTCVNADPTKLSRTCTTFYDPAFTDASHTTLRGAYASNDHAEAGPAGIASELVASPDFPTCVASNVASSFLGRALTTEDAALKQSLATALTSSSYSIKALVRTLVKDDAYRHSNNLASSTWRAQQGGSP